MLNVQYFKIQANSNITFTVIGLTWMYPAPAGYLLRVLSLDAQVEHRNVKLPAAALLDVGAHPE
jgi:hypothetical protein